jgi:hypothetical protein
MTATMTINQLLAETAANHEASSFSFGSALACTELSLDELALVQGGLTAAEGAGVALAAGGVLLGAMAVGTTAAFMVAGGAFFVAAAALWYF